MAVLVQLARKGGPLSGTPKAAAHAAAISQFRLPCVRGLGGAENRETLKIGKREMENGESGPRIRAIRAIRGIRGWIEMPNSDSDLFDHGLHGWARISDPLAAKRRSGNRENREIVKLGHQSVISVVGSNRRILTRTYLTTDCSDGHGLPIRWPRKGTKIGDYFL
jgi:hypothetical protein